MCDLKGEMLKENLEIANKGQLHTEGHLICFLISSAYKCRFAGSFKYHIIIMNMRLNVT